MKKLLFITALFITALFTSCSEGYSEEDYANYYTYATAYSATAETDYIAFKTDYDETFYVSENETSASLSSLTIGNRYVMGVRLSDSNYSSYDYAAKLYNITTVVMGSYVNITSEAQDEAIPNDEFYDSNSVVGLTKGFLNLYVSFQSNNGASSKVYLATNSLSTPTTTKENYVNFELRLDNGNTDDSTTVYTYGGYVSFSIDEGYSSLLEGKDGMILCIKEAYGDKYYEIPSVDLFD